MERAFGTGRPGRFLHSDYYEKKPTGYPAITAGACLVDGFAIQLLFAETTAIGLRFWKVDRRKLDRRWKNVLVGKTEIRIKESYLDGTLYNYQPEYEDCRKLAEKQKRPIKEILTEAIHQYLNHR